jgi:DNA adenine methylase
VRLAPPSSSTTPTTPVRPLLKWAGGKRQLLATLRRYYPDRFRRYVEPFVGSGAVFFDLYNAGLLQGREARLTDVNPDLIGCYEAVRDRAEEVIDILGGLDEDHRARGERAYYAVREWFNTLRAGGAERAGGTVGAELAAMFIYLNRTGFNGLYRLNRDGGFNVPAGRYANPRICDADNIRAVSHALRTAHVVLRSAPFETALQNTGIGDFIYCDPPYAPLSRTSSFAHYTAGGFSPADQIRLQKAIAAAADRGAHVLVSNSSAPEIERGYRRVGLSVGRVAARRAINSRASQRGPVDELIITNVKLKMAKAPLRARDPHQLPAAGTRKRQA